MLPQLNSILGIVSAQIETLEYSRHGRNQHVVQIDVADSALVEKEFPYFIDTVPIIFNQLSKSRTGEYYKHKQFPLDRNESSRLDSVITTLVEEKKIFKQHTNLVGVCRDWRIRHGRRFNQLCIVVIVNKKGVIPEGETLFPDDFGGFPVDVQQKIQ
jgi:hypothetical protein